MIKCILIVNNQGKPRLVKFYQALVSIVGDFLIYELTLCLQNGEYEEQEVIRKIFHQVNQRSESFCNYLEGCVQEFGDSTKIIYRHYATLHFIFAVDQQESDLGILDLIQVFVEALDQCFEGVCELDLIFHSDKVHFIVDEIIMGGMVLETNLTSIISAINDQNKLHSAAPLGHDVAGSMLGMNTSTAGKIFQSLSGGIGGS